MRFPRNKAHVFLVVRQNEEWDEAKHPREDDGRFGEGSGEAGKESESPAKGGKSGVTSREEKQRKIASVKIDFDRDNTLPGLNAEDLARLGKADKPVLLKKSIIDRNFSRHPEIDKSEYNELLGKALYDHSISFPGQKNDYVNFASKLNDKDNSLVLVEMSEENDKYEIVHLMKIRNRSLSGMQKKKPG